MKEKHLHIRYYDSNLIICGISIEKIRCRRRYGYCNLESGHKGNHDAYAIMSDDMIEIADDNDEDEDICSICLVDSY